MLVLKLGLDGTQSSQITFCLLQAKMHWPLFHWGLRSFIVFKAGSNPFANAIAALLQTFGLKGEK